MLVDEPDRFLLAQPFDLVAALVELADEDGNHPGVVLDPFERSWVYAIRFI